MHYRADFQSDKYILLRLLDTACLRFCLVDVKYKRSISHPWGKFIPTTIRWRIRRIKSVGILRSFEVLVLPVDSLQRHLPLGVAGNLIRSV